MAYGKDDIIMLLSYNNDCQSVNTQIDLLLQRLFLNDIVYFRKDYVMMENF